MPALIVCCVLTLLTGLGVLAPALESLPAPDACVEHGMGCAITVGHLFSY